MPIARTLCSHLGGHVSKRADEGRVVKPLLWALGFEDMHAEGLLKEVETSVTFGIWGVVHAGLSPDASAWPACVHALGRKEAARAPLEPTPEMAEAGIVLGEDRPGGCSSAHASPDSAGFGGRRGRRDARPEEDVLSACLVPDRRLLTLGTVCGSSCAMHVKKQTPDKVSSQRFRCVPSPRSGR